MSNPDVCLEKCFHESAQSFQNSQNSDRGSNKITTCLPNTRDIAYGWTLDTMPRRKETCWSNGLVNCVIKKKSLLWKEWQKGGNKDKTKRKAKSPVYAARKSDKKPNVVILKAMINRMKSLKKLSG